MFWGIMLWHSICQIASNWSTISSVSSSSLFSLCFKEKRTLRSHDQLVIRCLLHLRTAPFTLNECSQLVYCIWCEFSTRLETQQPPVMLYFRCRWLQCFTRFVARRVFVHVFTEAGVILQNKSLKVQYELLTASGLNASLSSLEIRKEVL